MICALLVSLTALVSATAVDTSQLKAQIPWIEHDFDDSVPQYVLDYGADAAPLIYLHSEEIYAPADIGTQLVYTHPPANNTSVASPDSPITLNTLHQLNKASDSDGENVYLSSNQDYTSGGAWLNGVLPNAEGKTENATSCAVIVNHKGNGVVDAYYMYFYAYNLGGKLLELERLGDHVGDWEHTMVRFKHGKPKEAWYSQHGGGTAYKFEALEKQGKRPVGYSGNGTHATWATAGTHDHTIPGAISTFGPLLDYTDKGRLWDPLLNAAFYRVNYPAPAPNQSNPTFTALQNPYAHSSRAAPTAINSKLDAAPDEAHGSPPPKLTPNWLYYRGHWGDDRLPPEHPLQKDFLNFGLVFRYTGAPNGPRCKQLNRAEVCEMHNDGVWCFVRDRLFPGS